MSCLPFAACTLALALALGACRQTVFFETDGLGGGGGSGSTGKGGGSGQGGSGGSFPPDGGTCFGTTSRELGVTADAPDLIVALDRSASMYSQFGPMIKLDFARFALLSAARNYPAIRFGYVGFPGFSAGCGDASCCPGEVHEPNKDYRLDQDIFACDAPGANCPFSSQRPTAAALEASAELFMVFDQRVRNRYVLLVTDGDPGCGGSASDACKEAILQASMLRNQSNVKTIVAAMVPPGTDNCFRMLPDPSQSSTRAYRSVSPDGLGFEIDSIAYAIAKDACHLNVTSQFNDPNRISLRRNGITVPKDGPSGGWDFDPPGSNKITLRNAACDAQMTQGTEGLQLYEDCVRF